MMAVFCPHPKSLSQNGRGTLKTTSGPLSSLGEGLGVRANSPTDKNLYFRIANAHY